MNFIENFIHYAYYFLCYSSKIGDALITQMADKNWKERKQALETVTEILNEAKFVQPSLGDLPISLKKRLHDSNKLLVSISMCSL